MSIEKTPHEWSKDALFVKAQRYIAEMQLGEHDEWQFGFWSALALEMLIRAALARISPTLVADGKDWKNILYAAGQEPSQKNFVPKSADIGLLLANAEHALSGFTEEMRGFAASHLAKRNSEIHSGALPFDSLGTSSWLPRYYVVCKFLLDQMDETLASLLGEDAESEATELINAHKDEAAKAVTKNINAHKTIWEEYTPDEKQEKEQQAKNASLRYFGHRVACPACGCQALLHGEPAGVPKKEVDEEGIVEKQRMLPASFECVACGLSIKGYSKLLACGLGNSFVSESYTHPIEYFNIDIAREYEEMMGDDNNE